MPKKTPGFIPTPRGNYCPKSVAHGIPKDKDLTGMGKATMRIIRKLFSKK